MARHQGRQLDHDGVIASLRLVPRQDNLVHYKSPRQMKFLLHSHFPAGHVYPMQAVAQALVARGHDVVWLASPDNEARVRSVSGAVFAPTRALAALDGPLMRANDSGIFGSQRRLLDGRLAAQVADYRAVLAGFAADVILVDVLPFGARALCDLGEVGSFATLGVIPLYTSCVGAPFPASGQMPPGSSSLSSWVRLAVRTLHHAWYQWITLPLLSRPLLNRQRAELGLPGLSWGEPVEWFRYSGHLHIQASSPTLDFHQVPRPRQHRDNIVYVGPLVNQPSASSVQKLPSWWSQIASHKCVVAVTQGTLNMNPASLIVPTIQALRDDPSILLVVLSPYAKDIESRTGSPDNTYYTEWLPYHVLLPQLRLFISNGGYGSVTQALSHKVPLLCAGWLEDKRDTAARVVWSGAGIDLKTENPSPHQVSTAVRKILGDASYQARVEELGDALNSLGGANRACHMLEALVKKSQAQ
ncbi:hypothetical protein HIM_03690 [Hirsutella minnesotensis 3608]|uniref:Erythromycin biosynthesis protein CIII-like C-terminal domain-containing protein n=1 Tax=Hirsutella minnesotensis 3608 TaxID=1043627 RepID=A0A0F7ZVL3_9HYPO|nr:hypothetical protein HIM_03690 [Hirsutella minnesotensis 3608]